MVDNPALRGQQDRNRIAMHEEHEVRYWTHHLGVTRDQLQTAVNAVGHSTAAVREFLAEGDSGTRPQQPGDPLRDGGRRQYGRAHNRAGPIPAKRELISARLVCEKQHRATIGGTDARLNPGPCRQKQRRHADHRS
jgi:hypothetical protein